MDQKASHIFAPYKALGLVCSDVPPVYQSKTKESRLGDVNAAIGNVFVTYRMQPFRRYKVSDPMPSPITVLTRDKGFVFAAAGNQIGVYRHNQTLDKKLKVDKDVKFMLSFVDILVIIDVENHLKVIDVINETEILDIPPADGFVATSFSHPLTYLNKVIIGGKNGELKLFNIKTGKLIFDFPILQNYESEITVIEQSTAIDVVAIGHANGRVQLRNLKLDRLICSFKQDASISAIAFRTDGIASMTTANSEGSVAVWDLDEKMLVGQRVNAHNGKVHSLYYIRGLPFLLSSGLDNRMIKWSVEEEQSLPVLRTELSGHSAPVSALSFFDENAMVSASLDGHVRGYNIIRDDIMKSLGKAREVKKSEVSRDRFMDVPLDQIIEIDVGYAREAAWDNVICLHQGSPIVSTWTTRRQTKGDKLLYHKRFAKNPDYVSAYATCLKLSSCGNFAFVGYSSGHVDMFNVQSGNFKISFIVPEAGEDLQEIDKNNDDLRAHKHPVKALATDLCNQRLITGASDGLVRFWSINPAQCLMQTQLPAGVVRFKLDRMNSLLCVAVEDGGLAIIDAFSGKIARKWPFAHTGHVTALDYSRDGKWLVSAADDNSIKVWDIATSHLIDYMKFPVPCVSLGFNPGGQFLATAHKGERAVYVWANMPMFVESINMNIKENRDPAFIQALPGVVSSEVVDEEEDGEVGIELNIDSDNECDERMDIDEEEEVAPQDGLFTFSGLPPSRWANLPDLEAIKSRNKPIEPPKKPKAAPFFLPTTETVEGIVFDVADPKQLEEHDRTIAAKRKMLEIETPFSNQLKKAASEEEYLEAFVKLANLSITAIDFQIRSLSKSALVPFVNMLIAVLESKDDLDLCQSYLNTFLRCHRETLWSYEDEEEAAELSSELLQLKEKIKHAKNELKLTVNENLAVLQWIKSAVVQIC